MKLQEAIEVHDTLNPKLWDESNNLREDVYNKLMNIYLEFITYIDIPLNVVDVEIVGSNASYNYNPDSDIDLHIIVNNELNYVDDTILQELYNLKKASFNDKYDLSIEGTPVELYIEDVNAGNATKGRYSLLKNKWILIPKNEKVDIPDISKQLELWNSKCEQALYSKDSTTIKDTVNNIYMMRKLGLAENGEYSIGNLVFKELRNSGMLKKLKDEFYDLRSQELSL